MTHRTDSGDWILEGVVMTGARDLQGERMAATAIGEAADQLLGLPLMYSHRQDLPPLGVVIATEIRDGALWLRARIDAAAPGSVAAKIVKQLQAGAWGLSVGGKFVRTKVGKVIEHVTLREASIARRPVNEECRVSSFVPRGWADAPDEWQKFQVGVGNVSLKLGQLGEGAAREATAREAVALPLDRARAQLRARAAMAAAA